MHHPRVVSCQGRSPKKFNMGKHKVLHLGRDNARHQHMWWAARLESSQGKVTMLLPLSTGFLLALPDPALVLAFLLLWLERTHLRQVPGRWMPVAEDTGFV